MATNLPVNIDVTYADDVTTPSKKVHQQHHDILHSIANALSDPLAPDPYGVRTYIDQQIAALTVLSVKGTELVFTWNGTTNAYELKGVTAQTAVGFVDTTRRKVFYGTLTSPHPKTISTGTIPIFGDDDEFQRVG